MNTDNLRKLADYLASLPEGYDRFNMAYYASRDDRLRRLIERLRWLFGFVEWRPPSLTRLAHVGRWCMFALAIAFFLFACYFFGKDLASWLHL